MGTWVMGEKDLEALAAHVQEGWSVLEAGSGRSTVIMAQQGAKVTALEHLGFYRNLTHRWLRGRGLEAEIRLCEIGTFPTPEGLFPWYETDLDGLYDFILVDGPPLSIGRQAAGFALIPRLSEDGELWLDDAERTHEKECLELWARYFPIDIEPTGRIAKIRWKPEGWA